MKRFKYRLDALLKVKEHLEKEKQRDLAVSTQRVLKQQAEINHLQRLKAAAIETQAARMVGKLVVADMLVYGRYVIKLRKDNLAGQEMLKVLKRDESTRRRRLLEATKQRRIYEKLKEKERERFNSEAKRLENKENDETAVTNYRRRRK